MKSPRFPAVTRQPIVLPASPPANSTRRRPLPGYLLTLLAGVLACPEVAPAVEYYWAPLAGSSATPEGADGIGRQARFADIVSITRDENGMLYVADAEFHTIRAINQAAQVTTVAGTPGRSGATNGNGLDAQFTSPQGVAAANDGTLYVADTGNHTIRKISPAGVVTTLAGTEAAPGTADGSGSAARFSSPRGVAVTPSGLVYVADSGNHTIRAITPEGVVSTIAGLPQAGDFADGTGTDARFRSPWGLALDASGVLYIADTRNHSIRKMTPEGKVSTLAGVDFPNSPGYQDGTGTAARFWEPSGLTVDANGIVYVAEFQKTIRRITPEGVVTTVAGCCPGQPFLPWSDGRGLSAAFHDPSSVVVDTTGTLHVADGILLRKIDPDTVVTTPAGGGASPGVGKTNATGLDARFHYPNGVTVDSAGNAYIADQYNHQIRQVTALGVVTLVAGDPINGGNNDGTGTAARFRYPSGPAMTGSGPIYVADRENHLIRTVTPQGVVTTLAGSIAGIRDGIGATARFRFPTSVATGPGGLLYVADSENHTIRTIAPGAVVTTLAGSPQQPGSVDAIGTAARFNVPAGVATDAHGNIYVTDRANHTLRKITPDGAVTTLAGASQSAGSADGTGTTARFRSPQGPVVDREGNILLADHDNHTIRHITPAGVVTTLGGKPGTPGAREGVGSMARFDGPSYVAIDPNGRIWVTDRNNHRIVVGTPLVPNVPEISVENGVTGALIDGTTHSFGSQWISKGTDRTFLVRNTGAGDLTGLAINIDGPSAADFTVIARPAVSVGGPHGSTLFTVRFSPTATGPRHATLRLNNNDPDEGPFEIVMTGTGMGITAQPMSQLVDQGERVGFVVLTTATPLTYQWLKDGVDIPGAQNGLLRFSARPVDIGDYSVRISHPEGSIVSAPATLEIRNVPTSLWRGLISFYQFNGSTTDLCRKDAPASFVNSVELTGSTASITGKGFAIPPLPGEPADQQGPGGYIRIPKPPLQDNQPFTASLMIKEQGYTLWHGESFLTMGETSASVDLLSHNWIGSLSDTSEFYGSNDTTLLPWRSNAAFLGSAVVLDMPWTTYTLVAEGNLLRLYRNGQLQGATAWKKVPAGDFFIGRHWWEQGTVYSTRLTAQIDNLRLYNRPLSAADVRLLQTISPGAPERNPYEAWAAAYGLIGAESDLAANTDGDAFSNGEEYLFGTPANAATPSLFKTTTTDTTLRLEWLARTDGLYRLMENTDLRAPWIPSQLTPIPSANQTGIPSGYARMEVSIPLPQPASAAPLQLYRVEAISSPLLSNGGRVTTQPASGEVAAGQPSTFSVDAAGDGASYQWRKNEVPLPGATTAVLTLDSTQPADSGHYSVVVTNAAGSSTSRSAYLLVTP